MSTSLTHRASRALAAVSAVALIPLGGLAAQGNSAAKPSAKSVVHRLPVTPETVAYGYYWSDAKPALRIASGDVIDVETLLTNTPSRLEAAGVAPADVEQSLRDVVSKVTDRGPGGHILTGPVYVEGADSGDVLEVKILSVDLPLKYGYNGCSGFMREFCERSGGTRIIPIDRAKMIGHFGDGIDIPLKPFWGSMGVAPPAAMGRLSSNPPWQHAGNLDNKELVAGTTLYIPVFTKGALFSIGDGHAAQGDGEVDQTAIETSLRGKLQLTVRKDMHLTWPRGETATHWIAMGTDQDLKVATQVAVREMVALLMEKKKLTSQAAYQLASIAADLRITQLVDGNVGVHMMIAKSILETR
ncbi:MAG: acetamidase/formamidase family protein [Gemmatimonadaceae bacterium]